MKKNIKIIIWIAVIAVLACGNIYAFGWKTIANKLMNQGANNVLGQVLNQVKQTGQVKIGDTILVPASTFDTSEIQPEIKK